MIFALILTPVMVIISVGGFGESLEVIKQKSIEKRRYAQRTEFCGDYFADGLNGLLLASRSVILAFYGGDSHHSTFTHVVSA